MSWPDTSNLIGRTVSRVSERRHGVRGVAVTHFSLFFCLVGAVNFSHLSFVSGAEG
jgi:hypothetical protein